MNSETTPGQAPVEALEALAAELRAEESVISPHVVAPGQAPTLGLLVAAGPRARSSPAEYALLFEAVREGYLLHYGGARVVAGADRDLALLAGDYLYALGLERLARLGDLAAVRELADLISLAAQVHARGGSPERTAEENGALWLAAAMAIASGGSDAHDEAKALLRAGGQSAVEALRSTAAEAARAAGIEHELAVAADGM
jgi:hypothetical protein